MNHFYKINHRYNLPNPCISVSSQPRPKISPKIAAFINKIENHQQLSNKPSVQLSPSYHEKINQILTKWQHLQKEKKVYKEQQQKKQEQDEFDRIMEEDLENQLKELERQEQDQYTLMEQMIEEQLEQEYQTNPIVNLEDEVEEYLQQFQELETTIIDEKEQKNTQLKKFKTWKHHEQHCHLKQFKKYQQQQSKNVMHHDIWKQKHDMYLKQIMSKAHQMKMNKVMHLLKAYYRTKKYYVQLSK